MKRFRALCDRVDTRLYNALCDFGGLVLLGLLAYAMLCAMLAL